MDHDYKWFLTDDLINLAKELFILDHVSEKAYFYKIDEYKIDLATKRHYCKNPNEATGR